MRISPKTPVSLDEDGAVLSAESLNCVAVTEPETVHPLALNLATSEPAALIRTALDA